MKKLLLPLVFLSGMALANAKTEIENIKVVITKKNESPTTITIPYWVAKAGSELTDLIQIDQKDLDVKKILAAVENANRKGTIMTVEDAKSKVVISVE